VFTIKMCTQKDKERTSSAPAKTQLQCHQAAESRATDSAAALHQTHTIPKSPPFKRLYRTAL